MITDGRVLAAVIDCEGCIILNNDAHNDARPSVKLEMCDPEYITAMNSAYPGGRVTTYDCGNPARRPSYTIKYKGEKAKPLLLPLAKYSLIKARQAEIALEALTRAPGNRKDLLEEMHLLNRRGRVIAPEALVAAWDRDIMRLSFVRMSGRQRKENHMITDGRVLAAVIDCEGCIYLKPDTGRPRIRLKMCDPQYVAALNSGFPGACVYVWDDPRPRSRPAYVIDYNGENARPLLLLLAKYCLIKGRQAEVALEAMTRKNKVDREDLIEEMHNLNRVGRIIAPEALVAA